MNDGIGVCEVRKYLLKYRLAAVELELRKIREQPRRQRRWERFSEVERKFSKFYENLDVIRSCDETCED